MAVKLEKIIAVNPESYALYGSNMGELAGTPNNKKRHTLVVEFVLDDFQGAYHQPDDLVEWINKNPYVSSVTFDPENQ